MDFPPRRQTLPFERSEAGGLGKSLEHLVRGSLAGNSLYTGSAPSFRSLIGISASAAYIGSSLYRKGLGLVLLDRILSLLYRNVPAMAFIDILYIRELESMQDDMCLYT